MAQKVFADWTKKELPSTAFTAPPDPTRRVVVVNKPDAVQTEVRAGHIGVRRNHQDYMALNMTLRILGGEGANRLHQVLRTERGLTYGAKAEMDTLLESGDFEEVYWGRWFYPVNVLALCLAAIPFAFGTLRSGGYGKRLFLGIVFALGFWVLQQVFSKLAGIYHFDYRIAYASPPAIMLAVSVWLFKRKSG